MQTMNRDIDMEAKAAQQKNVESPPSSWVKVWDLPTRAFHWLLVVFVSISFISGKIGGNAMQYHVWSGLVICVLLIFRLIWGVSGGRQSRFTSFVRSPAAVTRYVKGLIKSDSLRYLGHNPLGGWSILAMLFTLCVQVATGLFANDDIATEGPLYKWVSKAASDRLSRIHTLNQKVIMALIIVHVLAVLYYLFFKHDNLTMPMISGVKHWSGPAPEPSTGSTWTAAAILGLVALAVYILVQ